MLTNEPGVLVAGGEVYSVELYDPVQASAQKAREARYILIRLVPCVVVVVYHVTIVDMGR